MDLWIVAFLMGMAALLQTATAVATISVVTKERRQAAALTAANTQLQARLDRAVNLLGYSPEGLP